MTATAFLFQGLIGPLYILYAIRELGMGPAVLGVAIAAGGAGSLFGSAFAPALARGIGLGRMLIGGSVFYGAILFLVPLARPPLAFALICLLIQQFFGDLVMTAFNVSAVSLRQTLAPDHILGRVNAAMQLLSMGVMSVGALFGGYLAAEIGIRFTLAIAAAGVLLSSGWLVASPVRGLRGLPGAVAAG
jgi:predicted MFS family arabinose efflux permease